VAFQNVAVGFSSLAAKLSMGDYNTAVGFEAYGRQYQGGLQHCVWVQMPLILIKVETTTLPLVTTPMFPLLV
jgi:hypothetical protein